MSKLWLKLTPFSSDTSGFLSIVYGLGGLVLSFDPQGCINNYTQIDEPRWQEKRDRFHSAKISERDLVLGKEHLVIDQAVELIEQERPNFFVLLGGPISLLLGSDLDALAGEVEAITGVRSFGIDLKSHDYYDRGASAGLVKLAQIFLEKSSETIPNSVNLLGNTVFEFPSEEDYEALVEGLQGRYEIISSWGTRGSFDDMLRASRAEKNLVYSISGLALAKWMERKFAIPYEFYSPLDTIQRVNGQAETGNWGNLAASSELMANIQLGLSRILIVGEQITANALRRYIQDNYPNISCDCASFFMMETSLMEAGDLRIATEQDLEKLLKETAYDYLIGDPLLARFIKEEMEMSLIPYPHLPVSGQFFLGERIVLSREALAKSLGEYLARGRDSKCVK